MKGYKKPVQREVKTSPSNYTPNVKPAASKAVSSGPKVTIKTKYARKNMPNLKGAEPVYQMANPDGMNPETVARKKRRMRQGL